MNIFLISGIFTLKVEIPTTNLIYLKLESRPF